MDFQSQIQELKQSQVPTVAQLRAALLDPAVNLVFERMRKEVDSLKARLEETQNELSAWKFTPDRCDELYRATPSNSLEHCSYFFYLRLALFETLRLKKYLKYFLVDIFTNFRFSNTIERPDPLVFYRNEVPYREKLSFQGKRL